MNEYTNGPQYLSLAKVECTKLQNIYFQVFQS